MCSLATPLPPHAYFGAPDVPSGPRPLTQAGRKAQLDKLFDLDKRFRISLAELRSLDDTGHTDAGIAHTRHRFHELTTAVDQLLEAMTSALCSQRSQESAAPADSDYPTVRELLDGPRRPTPLDVLGGAR